MNRPFRNYFTRIAPHIAGAISPGIQRKILGCFTPVFVLHRIATAGNGGKGHTPQTIIACLDYLRKNNYQVLSLEDLAIRLTHGIEIETKSVVFTIDDGFYDQYEISQVFSNYEVQLTYFLISDFLNGELWPWDDQIVHVIEHAKKKTVALRFPDNSSSSISIDTETNKSRAAHWIRNKLKSCPNSKVYEWLAYFYHTLGAEVSCVPPEAHRPMTWHNAEDLIKQGHLVAPHSKSHRIFSQLPDHESKKEIKESFIMLKENLSSVSPVFAYPTGRKADFSKRHQACVRDTGLLCAVSTEQGFVTGGSELYSLPRLPLPTDLNNFIYQLTWVKYLRTSRLQS